MMVNDGLVKLIMVNNLVGGWAYPSEKYANVGWDDDYSQTTNQLGVVEILGAIGKQRDMKPTKNGWVVFAPEIPIRLKIFRERWDVPVENLGPKFQDSSNTKSRIHSQFRKENDHLKLRI